jgi:hypothetical protein
MLCDDLLLFLKDLLPRVDQIARTGVENNKITLANLQSNLANLQEYKNIKSSNNSNPFHNTIRL